jgi:DNA-binding NarL/FixJ family response regulator
MSGPDPSSHRRDDARAHGDDPHLLIWEHAAAGSPAAADLSSSELEVLRDAANGLTTRQSAESRSKSTETVKSQRTAVLAKLGARNMVQAVAMTIASAGPTSEPGGSTRIS